MKYLAFYLRPGNCPGWELWLGPFGFRWDQSLPWLDWNWGWWR